MSRTEDWSMATVTAVKPLRRPVAAAAKNREGWIAATLRLLRAWYEREQTRRDLSMMRQRDFGDLPVSPGAVKDEVRRWPWQKSSLR